MFGYSTANASRAALSAAPSAGGEELTGEWDDLVKHVIDARVRCGRLAAEYLALLFGDMAESISSVALVALGPHGMLAIGSHDGYFYVRTDGDPNAIVRAVPAVVRRLPLRSILEARQHAQKAEGTRAYEIMTSPVLTVTETAAVQTVELVAGYGELWSARILHALILHELSHLYFFGTAPAVMPVQRLPKLATLANELVANLEGMLAETELTAVRGHKSVEVRLVWAHKGEVVHRLLAQERWDPLDPDGDGLDNAYDTVAGPAAGNETGSNAARQDTDSDGQPDWRDADDDGHGKVDDVAAHDKRLEVP